MRGKVVESVRQDCKRIVVMPLLEPTIGLAPMFERIHQTRNGQGQLFKDMVPANKPALVS